MHQLRVPGPGRRKGLGRLVQVKRTQSSRSSVAPALAWFKQGRANMYLKDEIQRPQDDADRRILGYPFDWGACLQSGYCEIPQMLNARRTGFERLPLFMWPQIWAPRCCMHERSQLRSDRLGWHPGRVSNSVATRHHLD